MNDWDEWLEGRGVETLPAVLALLHSMSLEDFTDLVGQLRTEIADGGYPGNYLVTNDPNCRLVIGPTMDEINHYSLEVVTLLELKEMHAEFKTIEEDFEIEDVGDVYWALKEISYPRREPQDA